MKTSFLYPLLLCLFFCLSCTTSTTSSDQTISYELSTDEQQKLTARVDELAELDQKYRRIISLGTMDEDLLKKDEELRKTASLEDYIAFSQSVEKTLDSQQIDSLWALQHKLDFQNYTDFKEIISEYGYLSKERLNVEGEKLFQILLHPPIEIEPTNYLKEMEELLIPEVKEKRMEANSYATFVDNMKAKILDESQLYGTNKSFDPATMSMGLPEIEDIETTNEAREEIGLSPLQEGEYKIKGE